MDGYIYIILGTPIHQQSVTCNKIISISTRWQFWVLNCDQRDHHANHSMAFIVVTKGVWSRHQGWKLHIHFNGEYQYVVFSFYLYIQALSKNFTVLGVTGFLESFTISYDQVKSSKKVKLFWWFLLLQSSGLIWNQLDVMLSRIKLWFNWYLAPSKRHWGQQYLIILTIKKSKFVI